MRNVCKDLELDLSEFVDALVALSSKGFVKILRIPCSEEMQVELHNRFLEIDVLSTLFGEGRLREKREQIIKTLRNLGSSNPKLDDIVSLQELVSYSSDIDDAIQSMNQQIQSTTQDQHVQGEDRDPARTGEQTLKGLQNKLDKAMRKFWQGMDLLREEEKPQDNTGTTPRIIDVASLSTNNQEIAERKCRPVSRITRMKALLLAMRANAVARVEAPPELVEELEELEARTLIGEISQETLNAKKKELEQRIAQSQLAAVSTDKTGELIERLQKRIEVTNNIVSAGLISKALGTRIIGSATFDLNQVKKNLPRQLADFYVDRSGGFLDKMPVPPYLQSR
jgi:hypothetical protein